MNHYSLESYRVDESIGHLLTKVNTQMRKRLDAELAGEELTCAQWLVLMKLAYGGQSTAAELAEALNQDTGAITRMIDRLEAKGLLRRSRSTQDRRVVELELTEAGQACKPCLPKPGINVLNHALRDFSVEEVAQLKNYLRRMAAACETPAVGG